jgi:hypothetical protein
MGRLVVGRSIDIVEDRAWQPPPRKRPEIMEIMAFIETHSMLRQRIKPASARNLVLCHYHRVIRAPGNTRKPPLNVLVCSWHASLNAIAVRDLCVCASILPNSGLPSRFEVMCGPY